MLCAMRGPSRLLVVLLCAAAVALPACSKGGLPDVVGMDVTSAKETLAEAGYTDVRTHVVDGPSDVGFERDYEVVTQTPPAGSNAAKTDPIDLGIRFSGPVPAES